MALQDLGLRTRNEVHTSGPFLEHLHAGRSVKKRQTALIFSDFIGFIHSQSTLLVQNMRLRAKRYTVVNILQSTCDREAL